MNEWISVKERGPEPDLDVLIIENGGFMSVASLNYFNNKPWKWLRCGPKITFDNVTYWMPLPEPPNCGM